MGAKNESKAVTAIKNFNALHSFLYLHPSENPMILLISPALGSHNYHSWSKSFSTALSAKNKLEFIDGAEPKSAKTDLTYQTWKRCNNMVVSWLTHFVSSSIRQSIIWMDKYEDIWKDLKSMFFMAICFAYLNYNQRLLLLNKERRT